MQRVFAVNIKLEEENRLCVEMTGDDLARFDLDYPKLDYSNQKTKIMLRTVLDAAKKLFLFSPDSDKLLIEVFPAPAGGCTVFFSGMPADEGTLSRNKRQHMITRVYDFEDSEKLLCALGLLYSQDEQAQSDLFELSGRYRLVVRGELTGVQSESILREFSLPLKEGRLAAAYTTEHGRLLASGCPAMEIGRLISL